MPAEKFGYGTLSTPNIFSRLNTLVSPGLSRTLTGHRITKKLSVEEKEERDMVSDCDSDCDYALKILQGL